MKNTAIYESLSISLYPSSSSSGLRNESMQQHRIAIKVVQSADWKKMLQVAD